MFNENCENEIQLCPHCGQPLYTAKTLEKRLGSPLIFAFEQYEAWKKLKTIEDEKLQKVAPNSSSNIEKGDSCE